MIPPDQEALIVFMALLERCVNDLHVGCIILRSRIKGDEGQGAPLSASSLAQEAQRIITHVEKIRYTKDLYNIGPVSATHVGLCQEYCRLQADFNEKVIRTLVKIANRESQSPVEPKPRAKHICGRFLDWLSSWVASEAVVAKKQAADKISDTETVKLADLNPELITALDNIVTQARKLLDSVRATARAVAPPASPPTAAAPQDEQGSKD